MQGNKNVAPSPIRLPEDLKVWLKHRAIDNRRSMNSEVTFRLEDSRRREEAANKGARE